MSNIKDCIIGKEEIFFLFSLPAGQQKSRKIIKYDNDDKGHNDKGGCVCVWENPFIFYLFVTKAVVYQPDENERN